MRSRCIISILIFVSVYTGIGCRVFNEPEPAVDLLLITIDTLRQDHLGCYGFPMPVTPEIDSLSKRHRLYSRCMSSATYTNPAHASLLTGRYPSHHGVRSNFKRIRDEAILIQEIFRTHGYQTAAFISGAPLKAGICGLNRGFSHYDDTLTQTQKKLSPCPLESASDGDRNLQNKLVLPEYEFNIRDGESTLRAVTDWLKTVDQDTPIFLWVHFYDPHGPYAPDKEIDRCFYIPDSPCDDNLKIPDTVLIPPYQKVDGVTDIDWYHAMYCGEIKYVDRCTGTLMRTLTGCRIHPLVSVITADHGEDFGEHDLYFDHGSNVYEPSLAIPLLFCGKNAEWTVGISSELVHIIDIFPSVISTMGFENMPVDGVDFLHPGPGVGNNNRFLYAETKPQFPNQRSKRVFCVRTEDYKYIYRDDPNESELYRMDGFENEHVNCIRSHFEIAETLRGACSEWYRHIGKDGEAGSIENIDSKVHEGLKALGYSN
ncbi:sulfatase [bacterium]|nr:sulfatase [candidate division CSSED10-310 bacterium]